MIATQNQALHWRNMGRIQTDGAVPGRTDRDLRRLDAYRRGVRQAADAESSGFVDLPNRILDGAADVIGVCLKRVGAGRIDDRNIRSTLEM